MLIPVDSIWITYNRRGFRAVRFSSDPPDAAQKPGISSPAGENGVVMIPGRVPIPSEERKGMIYHSGEESLNALKEHSNDPCELHLRQSKEMTELVEEEANQPGQAAEHL